MADEVDWVQIQTASNSSALRRRKLSTYLFSQWDRLVVQKWLVFSSEPQFASSSWQLFRKRWKFECTARQIYHHSGYYSLLDILMIPIMIPKRTCRSYTEKIADEEASALTYRLWGKKWPPPWIHTESDGVATTGLQKSCALITLAY